MSDSLAARQRKGKRPNKKAEVVARRPWRERRWRATPGTASPPARFARARWVVMKWPVGISNSVQSFTPNNSQRQALEA